MRAGLVMTACFAVVASAAEPSADPVDVRIAQARGLLDDLDPAGALKLLDAVEKTRGLSHQSFVELLRLKGIAWGTLEKDAMIRDAFRKLLMFAPDTPAPQNAPPRVRTPFFEAKDWASRHGPTTLQLSSRADDAGLITLEVAVQRDVYRAARRVRLRLEGREPVELPLEHGAARLETGLRALRWSALVLGERDEVLLQSELRTEGEAPPAQAPTAPVAAVQPAPARGAGHWQRPLGGVLLGVGAAALVTGGILGVLSSSGRARLTPDASGVVTQVSQRDAPGLAGQVQLQAMLANAFFIAGGALAAAGVLFVVLGPADAPGLALSPTPGGLVVHGSF